jgi:hypothetical protein
MVKDTKRDKVWRTILELSEDSPTYRVNQFADGYEEIEGFAKSDVYQELDGEVSERTIHDVIMTMLDYEILEIIKEPHYASVYVDSSKNENGHEQKQKDIYNITK